MPGDVSQVVFAIGRIAPQGLSLLGTSFAVAPDKIATAFHVVGANDQNLVMVAPRIASLAMYQDTSDAQVRTLPLKVFAVDPIRDLCILQIPESVRLACPYGLSSTDATPPGTPVTTFGFPHAGNGRMVLTLQSAVVGARIIIESEGIKNKHIVLNTLARDGQSGGPVFDPTMQSVVAVILGNYMPNAGGATILIGNINLAAVHQTTHAISAEYLRAMI
jgi:hypothetical protein